MADGTNITFPGPLLSPKMKKDNLMAFIQKKSEEILLRVDEPEQMEAYIFWQIMKLLCSCDGINKFHHARMLAHEGHIALAHEYCEVIATAITTCSCNFPPLLMEQMILMTEPLYKTKAEEPEWLYNLRWIHASHVMQFKKVSPSQLFKSPPCKPCTVLNTEESEWFATLYDIGELLGQGGFGSVYAAVK
ncbi:hypothetical protein AMELA_G00222720 [Ameiurus melas]|uniref:Sec16 Sec23-binding domain-containing protein n=1 Tax=Ameiurus melas TaxID=219545 RepID=A0A7J5ZZ09_AMEME|nr:hypothetical protein AMELA_G00222720 [Ameiurus melas]